MIRRIVLLPEPEGPSSATSWPAGTSNETSFTAWNVPYRFERFCTTMPTVDSLLGLAVRVAVDASAETTCGIAGPTAREASQRRSGRRDAHDRFSLRARRDACGSASMPISRTNETAARTRLAA